MNQFIARLLLGWLLCATSVHARLGETLAQCEARYGPVIEKRPASVNASDPDACVFSKSGITVLVEFKKGLAWRVVFRMPGMSAQELETLLKANMPEGGWSSAMKYSEQEFRLSADHRRVAVFTPGKERAELTSLEIASRDYGTARHADYQRRIDAAIGTIGSRKGGRRLSDF